MPEIQDQRNSLYQRNRIYGWLTPCEHFWSRTRFLKLLFFVFICGFAVYFFLSIWWAVFWICASSKRFAFILKLHHVCMQNIAIMHLLLWTFFSTFSAKNISVLNTCRNFHTNFNFKSWLCQSDPKRPCGVKHFNNLPIWFSSIEKKNKTKRKIRRKKNMSKIGRKLKHKSAWVACMCLCLCTKAQAPLKNQALKACIVIMIHLARVYFIGFSTFYFAPILEHLYFTWSEYFMVYWGREKK